MYWNIFPAWYQTLSICWALTLSLNYNDDNDDNDIIQMIFNSKLYQKFEFQIKDKHPRE